MLAEHVRLAKNINRRVHVLKRHLPYHESDHVLNIAYNLLAGGTCLEHIELRRNDEVFLDALGVTDCQCGGVPTIQPEGGWGLSFIASAQKRLVGGHIDSPFAGVKAKSRPLAWEADGKSPSNNLQFWSAIWKYGD